MAKSKEVQLYEPESFAITRNAEAPKRMLAMLKELGVGAFTLPRLRVPSGGGQTWEIETPDGPVAEPHVDVLIAAVQGGQRKWFRQRLTESDGSNRPPDCESADGMTGHGWNTLEAHERSAAPNEYDCAGCQWSQWESSRGEGDGQDCQSYALLFFFRENSRVPGVLSVPASSLKNLTAYALQLANEDQEYTQVLTWLSLEKQQATPPYSKVVFRRAGALDTETVAAMEVVSDAVKSAFVGKVLVGE